MNEVSIKGRFRTQLINKDGSIAFDAGEQDNLITDQAKNSYSFIGSSPFLCIGSGVVTAPSPSDTNLGNQVAASRASFQSTNEGSVAGVEGFTTRKIATVDFINLQHEVSELGIRAGSETGVLMTRSLIKDSNGNPTTISVQEGQTLRLIYAIYYYFPYSLGSGVTPTPHGDLHWEVRHVYYSNRTVSGAISAGSNAYRFSARWSYVFGIGTRFDMTSAGDAEYAEQGHRVVHNVRIKESSHDRAFAVGQKFINGLGHYEYVLTQPYTIPANYDISLEFDQTWGPIINPNYDPQV